jgi:hypothetical protein
MSAAVNVPAGFSVLRWKNHSISTRGSSRRPASDQQQHGLQSSGPAWLA